MRPTRTDERTPKFFLSLLDGIIRTIVGALIVFYPEAGEQSLTLLLSFYFMVAGLFKAIASTAMQFPSWGCVRVGMEKTVMTSERHRTQAP